MKRLEQQGERPTDLWTLNLPVQSAQQPWGSRSEETGTRRRPLPVKVMLFAQCGYRATYVAKRQRFQRFGFCQTEFLDANFSFSNVDVEDHVWFRSHMWLEQHGDAR